MHSEVDSWLQDACLIILDEKLFSYDIETIPPLENIWWELSVGLSATPEIIPDLLGFKFA